MQSYPNDQPTTTQGARERYRLQSVAAELAPGERVASCCRRPHGSTVDVMTRPGSASYVGLQTCGSVWACAVCASKVSERRREELRAAIVAHEAQGGTVLLVTYTIRHQAQDDLARSVDGLIEALRSVRSTRRGRELVLRWGVVGAVRALEVTHGRRNGWHPHVHQLLFLEGPVADPEALAVELRQLWANALHLKGLREVNDHGIDVKAATMSVAEYVAKFGRERTWGLDRELAKSCVKRGREGNLSPAGLLSLAAEGDRDAGRLWQEYARVFKGRRQMTWSRGLRDRLGLGIEETDEELAEGSDGCDTHAITLSRSDWGVIVANDARAEVLEVAARGDRSALVTFLVLLGCELPFDGMPRGCDPPPLERIGTAAGFP